MSKTSVNSKNLTAEASSHDDRRHWANLFIKEFSNESDRAAVIVAASIFDDALDGLLRMQLVANPASTDELFDGANAPFSTFSAKITIAYRLGLISGKFSRNLHLIRIIRNEFAHNIVGGSFEDANVKNRVVELYKSQTYTTSDVQNKIAEHSIRGMFMTVCLWMLWSLKSKTNSVNGLGEADLEFGFKERGDGPIDTPSATQSE